MISAVYVLAASGCGDRNVEGFAGVKPPHEVTRTETADQGSGTSVSNQYTGRRVTVGGSYLRRSFTTSNSYNVNAGLHGKPGAFK